MSRLTFDPSCGLDITTTTIRTLEDIATISYWGYRVVRHGGDAFFIHEAYYDHREGLLGIANRPTSACGGSLDELQENVELISQALNDPVLSYEDFAAEDEQASDSGVEG